MLKAADKRESTKKWRDFEASVAAVQQLFEPGSKVTHDEKIRDEQGELRQFDIVVRGEWAGHEMLGVIECKDKGRKIDKSQVDGFIQKSRSVRANFAIMVSRVGFAKTAIKHARFHGIGTRSLLPGDNEAAGFRVGFQSYARFFQWARIDVSLYFSDAVGNSDSFDLDSVLYQGQKVVNWFKKKITNEYRRYQTPGLLECASKFSKPVEMDVGGKSRVVIGIHFRALREQFIKTKFINLEGQAYYDWQTGIWSWPSGGFLSTSVFDTTFADWVDYQGEIPEIPPAPLSINLVVFRSADFDPTTEVVDLERLGDFDWSAPSGECEFNVVLGDSGDNTDKGKM